VRDEKENMDMTDIGRDPSAQPPAPAASTDDSPLDHQRWQALVSQIGAEIAAPLTAALERINSLTSTGRIDRASLRALREEVESARQVGMIGQQLTRFASGRLRQSHERLQLADVFNGVIAHRARETQARGVSLKPSLRPVEVIVDATLLFSLLNSTIDWALAHAQSQIEFSVEIKTWPAHGQLICRFAHRPVDDLADVPAAAAPSGMDSLHWRLLEQTAWTMGLVVERIDESHITTVTLEFPRTVSSVIDGVGAIEIDDGFSPSTNSQPLAGSHVLVLSSRRELRAQIRDALRDMGLIVDFVNSVDEAAAFCREGLPHAIVVESIQIGERFAHLRDEISAEVPDFAFIEIIEEGSTFEMSSFGGSAMARVGRDVLANSLPSALMFELSKGL
jgi:CheY-like chemotaxis protein